MPAGRDEQRLLGAWWLPSAPEDVLQGTLTVREGQGRLELLGSFSDPADAMRGLVGGGPPILCLHGAAEGKAVSLFDVRPVGGTVSIPGMTVTRYHADATLVGGHVAPGGGPPGGGADGAPAFRRSRFRFDALDAWAGVQAIAVRSVPADDGTGVGLDLAFRPRPDLLLADADLRVTLEVAGEHEHATPGDHHLRQWCALVCDHRAAAPLDRVVNGALLDLHGLLTLLTGSAVRTERMEVEIERGGHRQWADLHVPLAGNAPRDDVPDAPAMPLPLPLLGDRARGVFEAWFAQRTVLDPVLNLFAATEATPELYLEAEFLFRAQAVESLHRRTDPVRLLTDAEFQPLRDRLLGVIAEAGYERSVRDALSNKLGHLYEVSLRKRLKRLIASLREPLSEVFSPDNRFVEAVVDTRNYLTHYDAEAAGRAASGLALFVLTRKLRVLLQVALLAQLGLPDEFLRALCRDRKCFADVRYVIRTYGESA